MRLMAHNLWERGKTDKALVEAWGKSLAMVQVYSAEASRRVRHLAEAKNVKGILSYHLYKALDDADGVPKDVATVARVFADVAGITKQADVIVNVAGQATPFPAAQIVSSFEKIMRIVWEELDADPNRSASSVRDSIAARLESDAPADKQLEP